LYPENLEVSKVCSVLTDNLSFKIDALFNLKEILKYVDTKENLLEILKSLDFIKLRNNQTEGQYELNGSSVVYNLINVPYKLNAEKLLALLNLTPNSKEVTRLYKQSLCWTLVSDDDQFNKNIEKKLKAIKFEEDDKVLKYDISPMINIKKKISKKVQQQNYLRETDLLKVASPVKPEIKKDANTANKETLAWRRGSEVTTEE
jgi:hypothetical protein